MNRLALFLLVNGLVFAQADDALIRVYVEKQLSKYTSITISSVVWPATVLSGADKLTIDEARPFTFNSGFGYIPVILSRKEGIKTHSMLSVRLQVFGKVLTARRNIKLGEDLSETDFEVQEKDLTKLRGEPVSDALLLNESKAGMYIAEGTMVTKNMLRQRPLIKHGASLTGYVAQGNIIVSIPVTARDDGYPGETIRVVSGEKKIYKARVESADLVKILE